MSKTKKVMGKGRTPKKAGLFVKGRKVAAKKAKPRAVARAQAPKIKRKARRWGGLALLSEPTVRQLLIDMAGENTLNVIKEFGNEMSDEELARRTKIKVSEVRAVLNKMHSHGLVAYTRNRDKDSGWYSYLWKINMEKMQGLLPEAKRKAGELKTAGNGEELGEFYVCRTCDPVKKVPFDRATEQLFKCESCGAALEFFENGRKRA